MNIILISENAWNSPLKYQRHQLAEFLSRQENVKNIYFLHKATIRSLTISDLKRKPQQLPVDRKKPEKIKTIKFYLFPFQRGFSTINKILSYLFTIKIKSLYKNSANTSLISYQPIPELIQLSKDLNFKRTFYISVHDFDNMDNVSKKVTEIEWKIINSVDFFGTDSLSLYKKISRNNDFTNYISIEPACPLSTTIETENSSYMNKKIYRFIYFGTLANYLDWETLVFLENNNFVIDFIGIEHDVILNQKLKNSTLYPPEDFENAAKIIRTYDAIILPYKTNERNKLIIPAKIYECFSLGMPIFSPDMAWIHLHGFKDKIYTYNSNLELKELIKNFNNKNFTSLIRPLQIKAAKENTWDSRFQPLMDNINHNEKTNN